MVHQVVSQFPAVIAHPFRETAGFGIEQDLSGTQGGGVAEYNFCMVFHILAGFGIDYAHPGGFPF